MSLLPACHSRHALPGETEWFFCSHPQVYAEHRRVGAGACLFCRYSSEPPPDRPITVAVAARSATAPCAFRGVQIGEELCPTCRGSVRIKVFQCGHPRHAKTTLRECQFCADFEGALDEHDAG